MTRKWRIIFIILVIIAAIVAGVSRAHSVCPPPSQLFDENEQPLLTFVPVMLNTEYLTDDSGASIVLGVPYQGVDTLDIITTDHRLVRRVFRGPVHSGLFRFCWSYDNQSGQHMPPGMYYFWRHGDFGHAKQVVNVLQ